MQQGVETPIPTTVQEKLQKSLDLYSFRMRERLLAIGKIKAEVLAEEEMLDPNFNATIIAAQTDYHSTLHNILTHTASSIKNVQGLAGVPGLVVDVIGSSITSLSKVTEIQERVYATLEDQEEQAPLIKKQQLQDLSTQITAHEKEMDALLTIFIASISHMVSENTQAIKEQASDLYRECLDFSYKIKNEVHAALQKIDEYLTSNAVQRLERKLPRDIMSIHLTRGLSSASVAGPGALLTEIGHYFRKRRTTRAYLDSTLYQRSLLREPTSFEWECLRAVLKRHPIEDFSPKNPGYSSFVKELQMLLYLIGKSDRTLCENINLYLSLALNTADKAALKSNLLNQYLPIQRGFFSNSTNANNKHLAINETLASHLTFVRHEIKKDKHLSELQRKANSIIDFYVTHLIEQFLEQALFHDWVENNRNQEGENELLAMIVKIINNELADKSPSSYYRSFLCGVSLFCRDIGEKGTIQLEFIDRKLSLNFSGCLSISGNIEKQEIMYPTIQSSLSQQINYV